MDMQHWLLLSVFYSLTVSSVLGDQCQCSLLQPGEKRHHCQNTGTLNSGYPKAHYDEGRGFTGDCLPNVEQNEMKCFMWRTRQCEHVEQGENCELSPRDQYTTEIALTARQALLTSPNFNESVRKAWGKRYLCIYNVTLNCPGRAVRIERVNAPTSWPKKTANCYNYVAFYNDRNSSRYEHLFCGTEEVFSRRLESSSFLAIMWNSDPMFNNKGRFQFRAKCADPVPTQPHHACRHHTQQPSANPVVSH